MIKKLTTAQELLIPVTREKWKKIALSTEPIDRKKTAELVQVAYTNWGKQKPEIVFFDSPYAALKTICAGQYKNKVGSELDTLISNQLKREMKSQLDNQLSQTLYSNLWSQLRIREDILLNNQLLNQLNPQPYRITLSPVFASRGGLFNFSIISFFDFCFSVPDIVRESSKWEACKLLAQNCGWIIPIEEMCFICDRPQILSFDSQNRLHAEGSPAIQFADGFSVYCYHGVLLTEQYGKVHPNQWRSQWLLEEDNAELRRVLIQGIGYERICQELQAIELDSWQEYALLKINADVDEEPMYLLKMTCPSTGYIHVLRVPPNIQSARAAISWVNWEVDPEDFSVQT